MQKSFDLTGQHFGFLTVLNKMPSNKWSNTVWLVRCECGKEKSVLGSNLMIGSTTSCGCHRQDKNTKHGMRHTRLYWVWLDMHQRCKNPRSRSYRWYGARGITVCDRWKSFALFYRDMGNPPPKLTLDRINNEGNYEPENCRWATQKEQANNRRPRRITRVQAITFEFG